MSGYTSALRIARSGAGARHHRGSVGAWAATLWARFALMRRAAETRRELGGLNPRLLADIGVSRAEASREAERWPWDLEPDRRLHGRGTGAHW